jgi:hypothetical protein
VVRARQGQTLTVRLSRRHEGDNRASLAASESPDFYTGEPVKFGTEYNNGTRWVGKIARSGDYYGSRLSRTKTGRVDAELIARFPHRRKSLRHGCLCRKKCVNYKHLCADLKPLSRCQWQRRTASLQPSRLTGYG